MLKTMRLLRLSGKCLPLFLLICACHVLNAQWRPLVVPPLKTIPYVDDLTIWSDTLYANSGRFRSTDGGQTWSSFVQVRLFGINPRNGHLFAMDTTDNLIKSIDGGQSWHIIGPSALIKDIPNANIGELEVGGISTDFIMGRGNYDTFKWTENEGWAASGQPGDVAVFNMTIEGDDIWLASFTYPLHGTVNSNSFTQVNLTGLAGNPNQQYIAAQGDTVLIAYPTDNSNQRFYIARTTDNGAQWSVDSTSFTVPGQSNSMTMIDAHLPFVLHTPQGTFISYTGWKDWENIGPLRLYAALPLADGTVLFPHPEAGFLKYDNGSLSFAASFWDTPAIVAPQKYKPRFFEKNLFFGQSPVEMALSEDYGETWQVSQQPWPNQGMVQWNNRYLGLSTRSVFSATTTGQWDEPQMWNNGDGRFIAVTGTYAYALFAGGTVLHTENGNTWTVPGVVNQPYGPFQEINFGAAAGKIFYLGPITPGFNPPAGLRTSADHGATWTVLPGFEDLSINSGRMYAFDEYLFIAQVDTKNVLRSADGGATFQTLPVPQATNPTAFRLRSNNRKLYLSFGNDSLYISHDRGDHWQLIPPPFPGFFKNGIDFSNIYSISAADSVVLVNHKTLGPYCFDFRTVRQRAGRVFWDSNNNSSPDAGEPGISDAVLKTSVSKTYGYTDAQGFFNVYPALDGDTVRLSGSFPHFTVQPAYISTGTTDTAALYFAVQATENVRDVSLHVAQASVFAPGFENKLLLTIVNNGSETSDGRLKLALSSTVTFLSADPSSFTMSGDTVIWDYSGLQPFQKMQFSVRLRTNSVNIGTQITMPVSVTAADDIHPADNLVVIDGKVVGSFDPNEKSVQPAVLTPDMSEKGARLTYTIRFQNTGNFPTAFVVLRDTLLPELDVESIRFIGSSHPCTWRIMPGRVIEFYFASLALPPVVTNEPGSHGFVQFTADLSRKLALNEVVKNRAAIFFDYNPAIITNDAESTVKLSDTAGADLPEYQLLPNPVSENLFIRWSEYPGAPVLVQMIDAAGRICLEKTIVPQANSQLLLKVNGLPNGIYTIRLIAKNGTESRKKVVILK